MGGKGSHDIPAAQVARVLKEVVLLGGRGGGDRVRAKARNASRQDLDVLLLGLSW